MVECGAHARRLEIVDRWLHSSTGLFVAVLATAALGSQEGMLQGLAKQAKAEGRKAIRVSSSSHADDAKTDADTYLEDYSVAHCGNALFLSHPEIDLFQLDAKGHVTWTGLDDFPFIHKLLQLKTVPAIARYVRGLK